MWSHARIGCAVCPRSGGTALGSVPSCPDVEIGSIWPRSEGGLQTLQTMRGIPRV